jgi:two-component system sensor histidine kinase/response regulator
MPLINKHPSLEILEELTNRLTNRDSELLRRNKQLLTLVEILKILLKNNDINLFEKVIIMLSDILKESRIYLYKNVSEDGKIKMSLVKEIVYSDSVSSYNNYPEMLVYDNFPVFSLYVKDKQLYHVRVAELPNPERILFDKVNTKVVLRIPIFVKNIFWGFIGIDNCEESILWDAENVAILSNIAIAMELYLKNKKTEEDFKNLQRISSDGTR